MKLQLSTERSTLIKGAFYPVCAVCRDPIFGGPDMHEAILTRRDIMGVEKALPMIMRRENCVLVHPGGSASKCHSLAHSDRVTVIRRLIEYEGFDHIMEWLEDMKCLGFRSGIVDERINQVLEASNDP